MAVAVFVKPATHTLPGDAHATCSPSRPVVAPRTRTAPMPSWSCWRDAARLAQPVAVIIRPRLDAALFDRLTDALAFAV